MKYLRAATLPLICGTIAILFATIASHQVIRMGVDSRLSVIAQDAGTELVSGALISPLVAGKIIQIKKSGSAFLSILDNDGKILGTNGSLEGVDLIPPKGVLEYTRAHTEERVTWEPQQGVRIATVLRYIAGETPMYVVAGVSLAEAQRQICLIRQLALLAWIFMCVVCIVISYILNK